MNSLNFKKEVSGSLDEIINKVTPELQKIGFGILTRIDFHSKIKEKLNKDIQPVVILGACNPQLAFEAYQKNTDVTSLIPCNVVLRQLGNNKISVEITKPTSMMQTLGDQQLVDLACEADLALKQVLEKL